MDSQGEGESEGWTVRERESEKGTVRGMDSQGDGQSERGGVREMDSQEERERESGRWRVRKMDHMPRTFSMSHLTGVLSPFFGTSTEHVGSDLPRVHLSALLI